jgi:hypothetical protein
MARRLLSGMGQLLLAVRLLTVKKDPMEREERTL